MEKRAREQKLIEMHQMKYGSTRRIGIPGVTEFQRAYENFKSTSLNLPDN
jgi:hypothetical protein